MARSKLDPELALAMAQTFRTPAGKATLDYLRYLTNFARPANDLDALTLAHEQGQRWLLGVIDAHIKEAESSNERKPDPSK